MTPGQRVSLRSDSGWQGTVEAEPTGGYVPVKGDGGWSGRIAVSDLAPVEDKLWPPSGLETK